MHYVIVDIETTGGSPKSSKITEIAMYKHDGTQIIDEFVSLVNPGMKIPDFIVRLTGISDAMVENAPHFYEIAKKIVEFSEDCVFVAHNVGFDYGIIRHEFKTLGFDYRRPHLCTVRASRYLLPGHESYSLGKLTRALGIQLVGRHRAGGDAHATALLFGILHEKSVANLMTFLQEDINPKILHPNLDLNALEEIPNKTGIYKFYDDANRLIYIGKSKHIRKRIDQHLRNNKTKKGAEMMSEICRIEFELTGSELVALLYESNLIKAHKPIYNRTLRKNQFPYGLFDYTDANGYIHLYIEKTAKKTETPLLTFTSKADAVSYLTAQAEKFDLCQKLCGLYQSAHACFGYQVKTCAGACIQAEPVANYNQRVQTFIDRLTFENEHFYLVEEGRVRNEKCLVLVEHGIYRGYGFVPYYVLKHNQAAWRKHITLHQEDRDARTILNHYLRKNTELNLVPLDAKNIKSTDSEID
jgi:DNA polymerase-3 subunit epsilon